MFYFMLLFEKHISVYFIAFYYAESFDTKRSEPCRQKTLGSDSCHIFKETTLNYCDYSFPTFTKLKPVPVQAN